MQPPSTQGMRHRTPTLVQNVANKTFSYTNKNYAPGSRSGTYGETTTFRKSKSMYDISTPDFKERSAKGEIINSPMVLREEMLNYPLLQVRYEDENNLYVASDHYPMPSLQLNAEESIFTNNIDNAITDAYANVSANEGETLLWIGELKESISMLFDIGKGLKLLYEKTKKQRKKWLEGKLTVEAQQQLTLQLLYGILPLEQQIADFLDGLFKIKQAMSRNTARGLRVKSKSSYDSVTDNNLNNSYIGGAYTALSQETLDVVARAGVLYEVDTDDLPWLSVILDPKAVVSTTYALARLSFVFDWFINVGGTLAAWSPTMGVKELSAWVTVEIDHAQVVKFGPSKDMPIPYRSTATGGYTYTTKFKWRKPVSRSDLAVIPRVDVNLDIDKILAMVLLFAKIRR